jgi:pimeloyl-ACP methyl ester carboxylesterase
MQVAINGLLTHYEVLGTGKVVLMLHGWGDRLETFNNIINEDLRKYKIIRLDLPGFGNTQTPNEDFDLEKYADFVSDFLEKIGLDDIYAVIGHSNGGAIAIKAISTGKIIPKKLVLLASSGIRSEVNSRKKIYRLMAKTLKIPTKILPKKSQDKIKRLAYKKIGSELFVAENMQGTFKKIVSEDLQELSRKINITTLLIYGDCDEMTPLRYGQLFNETIPKSRIVVINDSRHMLHITHAKDVLNEIIGFLNE